jgi:hypothetical protein
VVRKLKGRFDSAGADRAPTDPRFKSTEQPNQNKDRAEKPGVGREASAGQQKNHRDATPSSAAFIVDVLIDLQLSRRTR